MHTYPLYPLQTGTIYRVGYMRQQLMVGEENSLLCKPFAGLTET